MFYCTFKRSLRQSVFQLRNDFLDSYQPLIVIIKLQLDSNESSGVKKPNKTQTTLCLGKQMKQLFFEDILGHGDRTCSKMTRGDTFVTLALLINMILPLSIRINRKCAELSLHRLQEFEIQREINGTGLQ